MAAVAMIHAGAGSAQDAAQVGAAVVPMAPPLQAQAPKGAPNVVLVLLDDVGFGAAATFGGGAASVDAGKQRRLVHAAQAFLGRHPEYADASCRFDVVAAAGDPAAPELDWLRDAFRADDC